MAELLQTERTYVKDLETCIRVRPGVFVESICAFTFYAAWMFNI